MTDPPRLRHIPELIPSPVWGISGSRLLPQLLASTATPVVYGPDEDFPVGGSRVLRSSRSPVWSRSSCSSKM